MSLIACSSEADRTTEAALDEELLAELAERGFTGRIEATLEERRGRPIDPGLAEIGRLLFFDPVLSLTRDNSCSGCHGPNVSFNGSQPIAIGVGNNGVVGPGRSGPHDQRRAPSILNAAFYPRLMWDSRFSSKALDPFDNSRGFTFPEPDGQALSHMDHLLGAQAFTPVINRVEMAGSFQGDAHVMRTAVAERVNAIEEYRAGSSATSSRMSPPGNRSGSSTSGPPGPSSSSRSSALTHRPTHMPAATGTP